MNSRILIADDHEMVRRGVRSLLESSHRGIQVLEASDGREAVEKTIESKPDLVILDISMPRLDGFGAAKEIRNVSAGTPILFLTFQKAEALTEVAHDIGINGYITKGESGDTLLKAVDAVLGNQADQEIDKNTAPDSSTAISPKRRNASALEENTLREERNRAEKELQHSEAHYRALKGNLAFGICRCGMNGQFIDVNQALATMLGYTSQVELEGLNVAADILHDPSKRAQLLGESGRADPLETVWRRKNGSHLNVRLSGREVSTDEGKRDGYEFIVEDVTKQRAIEDQLRQQAAKDPLTGLANYRHLLGVLDSEIKRFNRTGREFALLLFDLDKLKQINDRYGHLTGSEALCRMAKVLTAGCRNIDTAARFGGDEFAVVLPETGMESAVSVAKRLCSSLSRDGGSPKISVSAGVAIYPADGETIEKLFLVADKSLYGMKFRVRDRPPITY